MKNKIKIDKKIFVLIMLIMILITSTYAWFTVNKNVRVNGLNVQVETSGNIEISADAINWKTEIGRDDLLENVKSTYPNAINQLPSEGIYPVSSAGNVTSGLLDMFYGQVKVNEQTGEYNLFASKETEQQGEKGRFIAFDIFLKVNKDTTVYINSTSQIKSTGLINKDKSTGIENAARIAVLNQGNGETASQVQNLRGATSATIIEPNYDVHTTSGIANAERIYNISGLKESGNASLEYYGIKDEISNGTLLSDTTSTYFSLVKPEINLEENFFNGGNTKELINLKKGITKIRIYMWIEGQDVDCEDDASGAIINFDLQLTT